MQQRSLIGKLVDAIDEHHMLRRSEYPNKHKAKSWPRLLPTPGNIIFTFLLIGGLIWGQNSGAFRLLAAPNTASTSPGTIAYQGRLADSGGNPLTDTVNMSFRLYGAATGGTPLWEEQWTGTNSVRVSDGLFNVMLGSVTPIDQAVITGNSNLYLGITVGTDGEMTPRVQLGSVPFATQALTVPDGSISQDEAPFAPVVYSQPDGVSTPTKLDKPIIYTTWFHGSDEGYKLYDFSDIFTEIDSVIVTKAKYGQGNNNQVTFMVTDASGNNRPTPSEIKVWAYNPDGSGLRAWIQGYVVVIGR